MLTETRIFADRRAAGVALAAFTTVAKEADEMAILEIPDDLRAIGEWYDNFDQVGDEEVRALLEASRRNMPS